MATVKITNNRYTADSLYQWDKNHELEIYGLSLASAPKIHFTNTYLGGAIVRSSTMGSDGVIRVTVPNSLLQKPYKITAYICVYDGDTFESRYEIEIPVKERKKPLDYTLEADDEELYSFIKLEEIVENACEDMLNTAKRIEERATALEAEFNKGVESANNASEQAVTRLNTIKTEIDSTLAAQDTAIFDNTETANSALAIAKGKNQAHVFDTTEDMKTWLSDAENAGTCSVGDNLYIIALDVPDWWIAEVLTEADADTGFYYKIAPLEAQKAELVEFEEKLSAFEHSTIQIVSFDADTGVLVTKSPDYVAS